ncbi:hypothetical protein GCM10028802_17690 [Terrabacter terrigena]
MSEPRSQSAALAAMTPVTRVGPRSLARSSAPKPPIDHPSRATRVVGGSAALLSASGIRASLTMAPLSVPSARACQQLRAPSTETRASPVAATDLS